MCSRRKLLPPEPFGPGSTPPTERRLPANRSREFRQRPRSRASSPRRETERRPPLSRRQVGAPGPAAPRLLSAWFRARLVPSRSGPGLPSGGLDHVGFSQESRAAQAVRGRVASRVVGQSGSGVRGGALSHGRDAHDERHERNQRHPVTGRDWQASPASGFLPRGSEGDRPEWQPLGPARDGLPDRSRLSRYSRR
jgi:hypothetical protein